MASPAVLRKASRQNFSASEIAILTGKVEEKLFIIQSKLTNTVIQTKRKMKCGVKLRRLSTPKSCTEDDCRGQRKMEKFTLTSQKRVLRTGQRAEKNWTR